MAVNFVLTLSANPDNQKINTHYRQLLRTVNVYFNSPFDGSKPPKFCSEALSLHCFKVIHFYQCCWDKWHRIEQHSPYWHPSFGPMPTQPGEMLQLKIEMDYAHSLSLNAPIPESKLERWCLRAVSRKRRRWKRKR